MQVAETGVVGISGGALCSEGRCTLGEYTGGQKEENMDFESEAFESLPQIAHSRSILRRIFSSSQVLLHSTVNLQLHFVTGW